MKLAHVALATVFLAVGAHCFTQPAYPIRADANTTTFTNMLVTQQLVKGIVNLPGRMKSGNFTVRAPGKATEKVEVRAPDCWRLASGAGGYSTPLGLPESCRHTVPTLLHAMSRIPPVTQYFQHSFHTIPTP
jgi:hypothetical protein